MRLFRRRTEAAPNPTEVVAPASAPPREAPRVAEPPPMPLVKPIQHHAVRLILRSQVTGAPLAGVTVTVHPWTEWGKPPSRLAAQASGVSDAEGVARFLLPTGAYTAIVRQPGGETRWDLDVAGRLDAVVQVAEAHGKPLHLLVRRGGRPVAGERVTIENGPVGTTAADGSALFVLPVGAYVVRCAGESSLVQHAGAGVPTLLELAAAPVPEDHLWVPGGPPAPPPTRARRPVDDDAPFAVAGARAARPFAAAQQAVLVSGRPGERYEHDRPEGTGTYRVHVRWDA